MKVKILGSGIPTPNAERCGQGILISHGDNKILFDCGPGVNRQIIESGLKHNSINHLFFTHLHWDHFGDYDSFVQTGFITDREIPLQVYGPLGMKEVTELLFNKVYYRDLIYRRNMRGPGAWKPPIVEEVFGGAELYIDPFTIKVFRVHHGEYVDYSLSYRIECQGKSVVISGDTGPVLGFSQFAKNCDLLIHEVFPGKPSPRFLTEAHPDLSAEELVNMMGHCSPRQVGEIAQESQPKKLLLNHLPPNLPDDLIEQIKVKFEGEVQISHDLMEIVV
ncbi:ribonuclease BN (tRNA processing enzyme) [Evansella vedderi]|uniref:Ribonuclease BN (tRNA processing enzyme) n=1 Tax=Evansella vedderi TaxID=38282 RepID=A0ABU0A0S2_9BACI|nr:MBL fold metallo-hydrolase [Evansella vedderi]MDQ0257076.1 ribonuclease BN (tRNA processing enzyme) [Evansella vedderi]